MPEQITASDVRRLFRYEADGTLHWRHPERNRKRGPLGAKAGHGGRLQVRLRHGHEYVHRLIWVWHHGYWPKDQIDHINGDRLDNRIQNLRELDNAANCQNRRHRGVTFEKRAGKWRARIMVDGRSISLGYYVSEVDALDAYQDAKLRLHESFASGVGASSAA